MASFKRNIIRYTLGFLAIVCVAYVFVNANLYNHSPLKFGNVQTCNTQINSKKIFNQLKNVNSIPGTTGPGVPNIVRSTLSKKYGPVDESASSFYGAGSGKCFFLT